MFLLQGPAIVRSLGHDPETSQWLHIEPARYTPEMFLVFKRLGYRASYCYAYEVKLDGVTVSFILKSVARFDTTTTH